MEGRQIPLVLAVAVCVAMLVAVPALGVGVDQPTQVDNNTTSEANGTFGQQVAAFMQTSAVDANTTVESGMWNASVNASATPERAVTNRTAKLERERQRLQRQIARLDERGDRLPAVAYTAQASALDERLDNLRARINATAQTATRVGANTSALAHLRTQASNMTGPEVAAHARTITDAPRGPPTARGPQRGPMENRTGPQDDRGPRDAVGANDTRPDGERHQRMTGTNETRSPTGQHGPSGRIVDGNSTDETPGNETEDTATKRNDGGPRGSSDSDTETNSRESADLSVSTTILQLGAVVW